MDKYVVSYWENTWTHGPSGSWTTGSFRLLDGSVHAFSAYWRRGAAHPEYTCEGQVYPNPEVMTGDPDRVRHVMEETEKQAAVTAAARQATRAWWREHREVLHERWRALIAYCPPIGGQ